jgi:hypothetical protein
MEVAVHMDFVQHPAVETSYYNSSLNTKVPLDDKPNELVLSDIERGPGN